MITTQQATDAVGLLSICRYFPSSDIQCAQVAGILIEMVGTKDQLDWLVREQSKLDWKGPYELRVLFSSRFEPRDASADMDPERVYFERESAATDHRIAEWKKEPKLLGEASGDVTPTLKRIDDVPAPSRTAEDLHFEHVQVLLGKESKLIHISATAQRTPEERAALIAEMETKLGIDAVSPRFGYCAAFDQLPGAEFRFRPNLPICLA